MKEREKENEPFFSCISCGETYEIFEIVYTCKKCGSLLEVNHPYHLWEKRKPYEWKELFLSRRSSYLPWDQSGVWRFREWVMGVLPQEEIVTLGEGNSPLIPVPHLKPHLPEGVEIFIKQCGITHTGSFKDLGMTVLISVVKALKKQGKKIPAVICASTGDTSAALASYGSYAGIPTVVLLPKGKVSLSQLLQPIANGAVVLEVETDFDGCMKLVQELVEEEGFYLANSKNSLRIEGQKTVSYEIVEGLSYSPPNWIIIPGGNLGNVSALGKGLKDLERVGLLPFRPRIACVQVEAADPLYQSYIHNWGELIPQKARETLATAIRIGNPVSFPRAVKTLQEFQGVVLKVGEEELANSGHLFDRFGFYTCPHTAVALAGLLQLLKEGKISPHEKVVVISTAHGLKFTEFKSLYQKGELPFPSLYQNRPISVPPISGKILDAIRKRVSQPIFPSLFPLSGKQESQGRDSNP